MAAGRRPHRKAQKFANSDHLNMLRQGVDAWNAWRKQHPVEVDLSGADLTGADLSGADLRGTNLSGADLSGADGVDPVWWTPFT